MCGDWGKRELGAKWSAHIHLILSFFSPFIPSRSFFTTQVLAGTIYPHVHSNSLCRTLERARDSSFILKHLVNSLDQGSETDLKHSFTEFVLGVFGSLHSFEYFSFLFFG